MPQSILIIEDDQAVRASLSAWLRDEGFGVLEASTSGRGFTLFQEASPDLVLLDLGIGATDGMEMLQEMKRLRSAIPIIIVSGRTHISDAIEAFKAGAWDYVTKPIPSLPVFTNTIRNCLDQTRLQSRVRETQAHLYRLVQNLPVIIFILNRNLEFEFLNQTAEHILGFSPQEIQDSPKHFLRCIVPEDRKKFVNALRDSFLENSIPLKLEFRFQHKKGYQVHLLAQSISSPADGHRPPDRIEGMLLDMTRHSYLEKLMLQNEKLTLLRAVTEEVAHEIRNPLVSIGGFARKLQARVPESQEVQVILEECERLERMTQRINSYLEPVKPHLMPCSPATALSFALRLMQARFDREHIHCLAELSMNTASVKADPEILHRIFMNILTLGSDLVEKEGEISIQASETADLVRIEMQMTPVFKQLPSTAQQLLPFEPEGHAGLALSFRLLELLHGHLGIFQVDRTVTVQITLPQTFDPLVLAL